MSSLRRILLITVTSLFRLALIFGVTIIVLMTTIGTPSQIENTLDHSGAYAKFVPDIIQSVSASNKNANTIPFNDPGVQAVTNNAFPPEVIQNATQTLISGAYEWLKGQTPQLSFRIDLTENRQLLAGNLGTYAFNRLAAQPLCTTEPQTLNPFTSPCLPRYFNLSQERTAIAAEVDDLLPKTVYTAADLPKFSDNKTVTQNFPWLPRVYRLALESPLILSGTLFVLLLMMFALNKDIHKTMKSAGSLTLSSGIALIITPLLYEIVYPHINSALSLQSSNSGVNVLVEDLVQDISHTFYDVLIRGAIIVMVSGLAIKLAERATRPKAGYKNIAKTAGLTSSDAKPVHATTSAGLSEARVPLQTSESATAKRSRRHSRLYRKLEDKEF
jgi:hypothetical protein